MSAVPPASHIQLWRVDLGVGPATVRRAFERLSVEERARADRLRHDEARRQFILARAALRQMLGARLGLAPEAVDLVLTAHGKPQLASGGMHFNLSHSADLAVIALSEDHPIGVDVEWMGRGGKELDGVASVYFSPTERAAYLATPPGAARTDVFYRVWTRKEAVAKAVGLGLSLPGPSFTVTASAEPRVLAVDGAGEAGSAGWSLIDLDLPSGYAGAVAVASPGVPLAASGLRQFSDSTW